MISNENQNFFKKGTVFEIKDGNKIISDNFRYTLKNIYANGEYVIYNIKVKSAKGILTSSGFSKHSRYIEIMAINTEFAEKIKLSLEFHASTYPKN